MSWIDKLLRRDGSVTTTSPWTDLGATTMGEEASIRRPINIKRSEFPVPRYISAGDTFVVKFTQRDQNGRLLNIDETPRFDVERDMCVDSITRFEVIDEFGVDVGIGFVLGQAKR